MIRFGRIRVLIAALFLFAVCSIIVYADNDDVLSINNTQITAVNVNTVFIEGTVGPAEKRQITVRHGLKEVAAKYIPDTGSSQDFRIKLPAEIINTDGRTVFFLKYKDADRQVCREKITVEYIARQEQKIQTEADDCKMTLPGTDILLKAKATSGDDLIYVSEDEKVARVDTNGRVEAVGAGETHITIKQIGNGRYDKAQKTVNVKVDEIDAYKVTFHSETTDDEGNEGEDEAEQIIRLGEEQSLNSNTFTNGDHSFLGWATDKDGDIKYSDAETVKDIAGKGENVDLYAVWTGDGAKAALAWAINIANDNSFAYGTGAACHRIGCYFCGTNQRNKPKGYEKTYVCLTFVGAAYAHGAEDPEILAADMNNKMPMYENDDNFRMFSCWYKVGSCSSLTIDDLKPGDVIIKWAANNDTGHVCMYAGGDELVEASQEGWGANTISVNSGAARRLRSLSSDGRNYVMRYRY